MLLFTIKLRHILQMAGGKTLSSYQGGSMLSRLGAAAPTLKYEFLCSIQNFTVVAPLLWSKMFAPTAQIDWLLREPTTAYIFQIDSPTSSQTPFAGCPHARTKPVSSNPWHRFDFDSSTARFLRRFARRFDCTPPLLRPSLWFPSAEAV